MSGLTPTLEDRVNALGRRVTRAEEDVSAIIDTVAVIHRESIRARLERRRILDHLGIAPVTDAEVDTALGDS